MSRGAAVIRGVWAIARHEAGRHLAAFQDVRVFGIFLLSVAVLALLGPAALREGVHPDEGLFVVDMDPASELAPAVHADPRFHVIDTGGRAYIAGDADLWIEPGRYRYDPQSVTSEAAAVELERTVRAWLDARLADEEDQDAAFPLSIDLYYRTRAGAAFITDLPDEEPTPEPGDGTADGDGGDGGGDGGGSGGGGGEPEPPPDDRSAQQRYNDSAEKHPGLRPNEVEPPFPLRSLLLTFAYIVPLNFIAELYSGSILQERVRQRGLPLLSSPYSGGQILLGKSLPYIALTCSVAGVTTWFLGAGWIGFAAVLPILGFSLASALVLALLSRNQRGLTAFLVAVNVMLSTFLFLPAVFTRVHPVAFISPVAVVAAAIRGEAVTLFQFAYSFLPLSLVAVALTALAVALYRDETLMTPAAFLTRLIDGVENGVKSGWGLLFAGATAVPFALALEVIVLVFALTMDLTTIFFVFLLAAAFIEEGLKAIPAYAYIARRHRTRNAAAVGAFVGGGFFLGEKGVLIWSLIGLELLPFGEETLVTFGIAAQVVLVLAPLVLHATATGIFTAFAKRGSESAVVGWVVASIVHASYNGAAIWYFSRFGGGL